MSREIQDMIQKAADALYHYRMEQKETFCGEHLDKIRTHTLFTIALEQTSSRYREVIALVPNDAIPPGLNYLADPGIDEAELIERGYPYKVIEFTIVSSPTTPGSPPTA